MTGPEHYQAADQLLRAHGTHLGDKPYASDILRAAQVHATLALAAATAFSPHTLDRDMPEHRAWRELMTP